MEFDIYETYIIDGWDVFEDGFEMEFFKGLLKFGFVSSWYRTDRHSDLIVIPIGKAYLDLSKATKYFK